MAADDPVRVWDLDGPVRGPLADGTAAAPKAPIALDGVAFGTTAFALEAWVRGRGTVATYSVPDGPVLMSVVVRDDGGVDVVVPDAQNPSGSAAVAGNPGDVPQDGAWHHVALAWDGTTSRIQNFDVTVDGRNAWMGSWAKGELADGGVMTVGPYPGGLDEVAWYDRYVHESAFLGHVFVRRGVRPPRTPWKDLPLEVAPTFGASTGVYDLDVSPDGRLVLVGSDDSATLWDLDAGVPIRRYGAGVAVRVAFSPDAAWAWTTDGATVRAWETATGELVREWTPGGRVDALAPTADGRAVLVGLGDDVGKVLLWDGSTARQLGPDGPPVFAVAGRPDAQRALSCGKDGVLNEWDVATGALVQAMGGGDPCRAVAYSAGGGIAVANLGWVPIVWNLENGQPVGRLEVSGPVDDVAMSDDGAAAVAGGSVEDGTLHSTNLQTGAFGWFDPVGSGVHTDTVTAVDYARDGGIVSGGYDGRLVQWRWDTFEGPVARPLVRRTPSGPAVFTADGRTAVVGDEQGGVRVWDVGKLSVRARLPLFDAEVGELAISPDGSRALVAWSRPRGTDAEVGLARVALVDLNRGSVIANLSIPTDYVFGAAFTPDGKYVGVGDLEHVWTFDALAGTKLAELAASASSLSPGPAGSELWAAGKQGWQRLDVRAGLGDVAVPIALADGEEPAALARTTDGRVATITRTLSFLDRKPPRVVVVDASGKVVREWKDLDAHAVAWSPDGATLAVGDGPDIALLDVATGERKATLRGHAATVTSVAFTGDGHLTSAAQDGTFRRWNLDGGWLAFAADGLDWLVWDDAGYFDASAGGSSLVRAVRGTTSFAVDQLALERDRPDELLQRFGLGEQGLLEHYHAVWERRMRRAGLDPTAPLGGVDLPTARVVTSTPSYDHDAVDVVVDLRADAGLKAYQVWVDDVPVYAGLGKPVDGPRARLGEHVPLVAGDRRVEVSAIDVSGHESLRAGVDVPAPPAGAGALWYVGFGVSQYANPKLNDLGWAHQDALDLKATLEAEKGFSAVHTLVATDDAVTTDAIRSAKTFLAQAKPGDTVVVFVAGHGVHDSDAAATYYYLVHDTDPDDLAHTAAPFELVEGLLDGVAARHKLFLLDTCQSGEADDDDAVGAAETQAKGTEARAVRGAKISVARANLSPRPWLRDKDRLVYQDLVRRTGAIVFSSSLGSEYSLESDAWRNGAFTEALLEALRGTAGDADHDGTVDTAELRKYVTARVRDLTHDEQHPTVDRDNPEQRFGFGY